MSRQRFRGLTAVAVMGCWLSVGAFGERKPRRAPLGKVGSSKKGRGVQQPPKDALSLEEKRKLLSLPVDTSTGRNPVRVMADFLSRSGGPFPYSSGGLVAYSSTAGTHGLYNYVPAERPGTVAPASSDQAWMRLFADVANAFDMPPRIVRLQITPKGRLNFATEEKGMLALYSARYVDGVIQVHALKPFRSQDQIHLHSRVTKQPPDWLGAVGDLLNKGGPGKLSNLGRKGLLVRHTSDAATSLIGHSSFEERTPFEVGEIFSSWAWRNLLGEVIGSFGATVDSVEISPKGRLNVEVREVRKPSKTKRYGGSYVAGKLKTWPVEVVSAGLDGPVVSTTDK